MTTARKKKTTRPAEKAIQFKVQLRYIRPPIWRRVVLPDNATLGDLHQVIQAAMGWFNCHMHSFCIGGVNYTSPDASEMEDMDILEALKAKKPTEEQEELLEWVGEDYDPERFDLDEVNRWLHGRR